MQQLSKRQIDEYCGDMSQLFGIRECIMQEGKSKGTRALHIRNGQGLEMTVLPDKCFAVPELFFQGINIGFISKAGICAPEFFQEEGTRGFLRNFEAGFLTTCGLTYMGTPGIEEGQANGLHGVISNTPAEHIFSGIKWEKECPWIEFGGEVREAHLFGPNLKLLRKVRISTCENKMWICDSVDNHGFEKSPLMLLYHFNIGYPMLDESCLIYSNMNQIVCREAYTKEQISCCNKFQKPEEGYEEEVYFRTAEDEEEKEGFVMIHNENHCIAVLLKFFLDELPVLNQWKCPRAGDYAMGLEPGTCHVGGRIRAKAEQQLEFINAGEHKEFHLEIEFIDSRLQNEKLNAFINKTKEVKGRKEV